jgi:hypothetical protein
MSDEDKEFEKLEAEIETKGRDLRKHSKLNKRPEKYGLCATCVCFTYYKTIYEKETASCSKLHIWLNSIDRIKECVDYYPFDQQSLYDMIQLAHIISPGKLGKLGF